MVNMLHDKSRLYITAAGSIDKHVDLLLFFIPGQFVNCLLQIKFHGIFLCLLDRRKCFLPVVLFQMVKQLKVWLIPFSETDCIAGCSNTCHGISGCFRQNGHGKDIHTIYHLRL